jgi:drug/metabolite transporter (DMT)-like permease
LTSPPSTRAALAFLVLTALLWSSSGLFFKLVTWHPLSIFGGRAAIASVVFLIYLRGVRFRWTRMQAAGAAGYAASQFLFILANKLTTAANAIFLQYTAPVYVMLLGYWILGERPRRADWVTTGAILLGLLLFFGEGLSLRGVYGNLAAILSGMSFALMMVCMRAEKDGDPAQVVQLGSFVSAVIGVPWLFMEHWTLADTGIILYLGLFQISLSFILYAHAIRRVNAVESVLVLTLEPVLNPIWVLLVLGEMPGAVTVLGGAIVIGAVLGRALFSTLAPGRGPGLDMPATKISDEPGLHLRRGKAR